MYGRRASRPHFVICSIPVGGGEKLIRFFDEKCSIVYRQAA